MEKIINAKNIALAAALVAFKVAKVAAIVAIVFTCLVGGYVLAHSELRNQTIDFAQGQTHEAPKAN